jgi:hypothetical protein
LQWERAEIRDRAALLITNPDMLHCSVLPVHRTFARLLAHLRYVVVDEGHAYRCPACCRVPPQRSHAAAGAASQALWRLGGCSCVHPAAPGRMQIAMREMICV